MASPRVGAAWRALGPDAQAWYRAALAEDIEALRQSAVRADAAERSRRRFRRTSARERQYLSALAATF